MLTTGIDIRPGTEGNDTFIGTFDGAATSTSNLGDSIDGGAGNDTVRIISNANGTIVPTLTNVENLVLNDTVHESRDVSGIAGLTSLELEQGTTVDGQTITVTLAAGQSLTLDRVTDGDAAAATVADGGISLASAAAVTALTVQLQSVGPATGAVANTALALGVAGAGVTTLNIQGTGTNSIALENAGGALTTVNYSGSGATTVFGTANPATITTVNASGATGGLTIDLRGSTGANQTITGGSGNDTFTVDLARNINLNAGAGNDVVTLNTATAANLSSTAGAADVINGGEGTDTLALTAAHADEIDSDAAADRAVISGFERLRITTDLNGVTVNAANISGGVNYVQLGADTTTGNGTISGLTSGATIENRANTHAGSTISIGAAAGDAIVAGEIVTATIRGTTVSYTLLAGDVGGDGVADAAAAAAGLAAAINTQFGAGTATAAGAVVTLATTIATAATENAADPDVTIAVAAGDAIETDVVMTGATGAGTPDDTLTILLNGDITNNDNVESGYGVAGINRLVFTTADRDNTDLTTDRNDGYIVNLTNDNAVSQITISGTNAFSFTSTATTTALTTVDASGLSGDLALNLATGPSQGVTITGGSGANTITGSGLGDIIVGGGRADNITGGNGTDVMTGGAGADTFVFARGSSGGAPSATNFDSITDWQRNLDIIDHADNLSLSTDASIVAAVGRAALNAEGFATFVDADDTLAERIAAVNAALVAGTEATGQVAMFEHGGSTFVFIMMNDANDAVEADDVLIRLTGVTGLSDATISNNNLLLA